MWGRILHANLIFFGKIRKHRNFLRRHKFDLVLWSTINKFSERICLRMSCMSYYGERWAEKWKVSHEGYLYAMYIIQFLNFNQDTCHFFATTTILASMNNVEFREFPNGYQLFCVTCDDDSTSIRFFSENSLSMSY